MKALSIQQPWASAIIDGPKRVENRGWAPTQQPPPEGVWIAVHASARLYPMPWDELVAELRAAGWKNAPANAQVYPRSAILGAMRVVRYVRGVRPLRPDGIRCRVATSPWRAPGVLWGWDIEDVVRLAQPVPCRGRLRLWDVPEAAAEVVAKAVDRLERELEEADRQLDEEVMW